ncbi:DUF2304 domain-containing protein [Leucobacter sp. UT-8R-CII-1-4]|uniref:DUF2304 domain-containing protein n=1 Tax=Leucobacter sp. UT-8R-CII-1-4 TaxID=3040075 RepID=UPI0024A84B3F|nr:DUF2304 domain-containing protein [Leucobacter sp. UT-8R-CII-1-4]MDI6023746.1 DUF2304 domain-containing protein [Leucobacter sp. UT-8R-CII-1-4]
MTFFQLLLIIGVAAIALFSIRFLRGERSLAIKRILALLAALAAVLSILFPTVLTAVANFFGIGRGADLLLYVSILGGMLFVVAMIRSQARSDARVTRLARAVALMEARMIEQQQTHKPSDESGESV